MAAKHSSTHAQPVTLSRHLTTASICAGSRSSLVGSGSVRRGTSMVAPFGARVVQALRSHWRRVAALFASANLRAAFSFQDMYVGLSPYEVPPHPSPQPPIPHTHARARAHTPTPSAPASIPPHPHASGLRPYTIAVAFAALRRSRRRPPRSRCSRTPSCATACGTRWAGCTRSRSRSRASSASSARPCGTARPCAPCARTARACAASSWRAARRSRRTWSSHPPTYRTLHVPHASAASDRTARTRRAAPRWLRAVPGCTAGVTRADGGP